MRASQLNGCAYCVDMHTKDFEALGEDRVRGYLLATWREANIYNAKERAALAWTEALTKLHAVGDLQHEYEELANHFNAK
ncbi:carboxymuconolactone decarboxylase family protein, partial [Staphylococcus sp. SIMBA_130]